VSDENDETWMAKNARNRVAKVRATKQSVTHCLQRLLLHSIARPRAALFKRLRAHGEHADDATAAALRQLGRIFSNAKQGYPERFAPKIPQDGTMCRRSKMQVVTDIAPLIAESIRCISRLHERSPLKFETLTKEYFLAIAQRML